MKKTSSVSYSSPLFEPTYEDHIPIGLFRDSLDDACRSIHSDLSDVLQQRLESDQKLKEYSKYSSDDLLQQFLIQKHLPVELASHPVVTKTLAALGSIYQKSYSNLPLETFLDSIIQCPDDTTFCIADNYNTIQLCFSYQDGLHPLSVTRTTKEISNGKPEVKSTTIYFDRVGNKYQPHQESQSPENEKEIELS